MWPFACSVRRFHEARALQLIEQEKRDKSGAPSDILLHSCLLLGFEPEGPDYPLFNHYPPSPLASSQLLNIFGTVQLSSEKWLLISDCVTGKGGLSGIRFQGLRDMVRL